MFDATEFPEPDRWIPNPGKPAQDPFVLWMEAAINIAVIMTICASLIVVHFWYG